MKQYSIPDLYCSFRKRGEIHSSKRILKNGGEEISSLLCVKIYCPSLCFIFLLEYSHSPLMHKVFLYFGYLVAEPIRVLCS